MRTALFSKSAVMEKICAREKMRTAAYTDLFDGALGTWLDHGAMT